MKPHGKASIPSLWIAAPEGASKPVVRMAPETISAAPVAEMRPEYLTTWSDAAAMAAPTRAKACRRCSVAAA